MKALYLSASILSCLTFLSACGGGSESTSTTTTSSASPSSITVIDGYLSQVSVYADSNADLVADSSELLGTTDESGALTLAGSLPDSVLIAKVIAGNSFDADRVGPLSQSYTLYAPAGSTIISPFSTLAVQTEYSVDDIADYLDLNSSYAESDYVALKSSGNTNRAIKTHAVARSITTLLQSESDDYLTDALSLVTAVESYIDDYSYSELDTVTLTLNEDETLVAANYATLSDYLLSADTWFVTSTNQSSYSADGELQYTFDGDEEVITLADPDGIELASRDYLLDGLNIISTGSNTDTLIAGLPDFALIHSTNSNQLQFWSTDSIAYPFESELITSTDVAGQTWYLLQDNSSNESGELSLTILAFSDIDGSPTGDITATTDDGASSTGSFYVTTINHADLGLVAPLYLQWSTDNSQALVLIKESAGVRLLYDINNEKYVLMTQDEAFAEYINDTF